MFFTARKNRIATEEVSLNIQRTWLVIHFRLEVFDKHAPTEDALESKRRMNKVLVISVDPNASTPKHGAKHFKDFGKGEKLFLNDRVLDLCSRQLATEESKCVAFLKDDGAKLQVGGIRFDVERKIGIRITRSTSWEMRALIASKA